jgi:hypothetical protein
MWTSPLELATPPESAKGDMLDTMIAVVIILFILSVINEKLVQLIRKYSPFIRAGNLLYKTPIRSFWRNISRKQTDNTLLGNIIEREVMSLSFWVGFIICILFRVDIFAMFRLQDTAFTFYWTREIWDSYWVDYEWLYRIPLLLLSMSLTAFFLTFGSKFFHDLLDTLFQVKNLKRKMVDPNTFDVESVEQLDDYLNKTYSEIIQTAIDQNRDVLSPSEAVAPPMRGKIKQNGRLVDCIDIHLKGKNKGTLPPVVQAKLGSGKIVTFIVRPIFEVEVPAVAVEQGDTIGDVKTADFLGTICCRVEKDGNESLLTCSHIVTGGTAKNLFGNITPPDNAEIRGQGGSLFTYAICTEQFDIALASPDNTVFNYGIEPKKARRPVPSDILTTKVKVVCRNEIKEGVIVNDCVTDPVPITYKDGEHRLSNLMLISRLGDDDVTQYNGVVVAGDSGACVYDEDHHPIGMIVAGSDKFSYAIPIVSILNKLTAKIV